MKSFIKDHFFMIIIIIMAVIYWINGTTTNVFLLSKNKGMSKEMLGDVLIVSIMVNASESIWTEETMNSYFKCANEAADFLEESANSYGAHLAIDTAYITYDIPNSRMPYYNENGMINEFISDFLKSQGVSSLYELEKHHSEGKYDEVCYVFTTLKEGRSYAVNSESNVNHYNEYVCFFNSDFPTYSIAHEVLHVFGAEDFYYSDDIKNISQMYLGESIMREYSMHVDGITAYLVGWKNELTADEETFLEETKYLSKQEYYNLRLNAKLADVLSLGGDVDVEKDEKTRVPSDLIYIRYSKK